MASLKSQKCNAPAFMNVEGDAFVLTDKIVLGASPGVGTPAAADTIDFRIPGGAQVCHMKFVFDDCDTGSTFVFGVGYRAVDTNSTLATNATYFAPAGQAGAQAAGSLVCQFKPIKFEEDVFIQLLVGTAPTGIAGNPEIHLVTDYNCQGQK